MKTIVSEKGQMTIPKSLRSRLGIRAGQRLEVHEERGRLVVAKANTKDSVEECFGILDLGQSTDEALARLLGRGRE